MAARRKWPHPRREDARQLLKGQPVCFDTMILTALARARRTPLVLASMQTRARIPERVAGEMRGHARGDPEIEKLLPPPNNSFGQLVKVDRQIAQIAYDLQRTWHGAAAIADDPQKDRGEAECLATCIVNRAWALFSQDHLAVEYAPKYSLYLYGLPELLMLFAAEGRLLPPSAWKVYADIANGNPGLVCQRWPVEADTEALFADCYEVLTSL